VARFTVSACTGQHLGDRAEQQDRLMIMASPNVTAGLMAVVADGMGGKTGGALAAEQVMTTARAFFNDWREEDPVEPAINSVVNEVHTVLASPKRKNRTAHSR
jgi:PPM family protein phosphatase